MRKKIFAFIFAAALLVAVAVPALGTAGGAEAHLRCALPAHQGAGQVIANGQNPHDDPAPPATHGLNTAREHSDAIGGCP
jgi:hypothetical protein